VVALKMDIKNDINAINLLKEIIGPETRPPTPPECISSDACIMMSLFATAFFFLGIALGLPTLHFWYVFDSCLI
jgi:hypothetical protein